jgi:hypothetical protein
MLQIIGNIPRPSPLSGFGDVETGAVGSFLNIIIKTLIVMGGIYAFFNLVIAGYAFMSAGDDSKKVQGAWAKIWQTILGLVFLAGSFVLAAIFGKLIYNNWGAILKPEIPTL